MSKQKPVRQFNRLKPLIDQRNHEWLEHVYPDIESTLREEIKDGATPEEIADFIDETSGEQEWFGKKIKGAARHIAKQVAGA